MMCRLDLFGLGYEPAGSYCDHDKVFLIDKTNKLTNIEMHTATYNSEQILCESGRLSICEFVGTDC
jgi:hypothetical protein